MTIHPSPFKTTANDTSATKSLTGHSLGGGLASAAARMTGLPAQVFNSAGLHPDTVSRFSNARRGPDPVTNHFVRGEALTTVQSLTPLPDAVGRQVSLPAVDEKGQPVTWLNDFGGLKRHLTSKRGAGLVGLFAVLLGLSFVVPAAPKKEPPFMASVQALSNAPISTLALVAKRSPQEVRATLAAEGFSAVSDEQSLGELAGPDMGKRMRLLRKVLAQAPKSAG